MSESATRFITLPEIVQDLINKVKLLSQYENRVAATLGGSKGDPNLVSMEAPFAWVVFESSSNAGERGKRWQEVEYKFNVIVGLPYDEGEQDFISTQLELLELTCLAVRGTPNVPNSSNLWTYEGCELVTIDPTKVIYQLHFSTIGAYSHQLS